MCRLVHRKEVSSYDFIENYTNYRFFLNLHSTYYSNFMSITIQISDFARHILRQ